VSSVEQLAARAHHERGKTIPQLVAEKEAAHDLVQGGGDAKSEDWFHEAVEELNSAIVKRADDRLDDPDGEGFVVIERSNGGDLECYVRGKDRTMRCGGVVLSTGSSTAAFLKALHAERPADAYDYLGDARRRSSEARERLYAPWSPPA